MKSNSSAAPQTTDGMTFYKTVEQKDANPPLPKADVASKEGSAKENGNNSAPPDPLTATAGPGYFVQVAAVTKQDDAQALVDALKKKQYAAFTSNTSSVDKFFHVQVGPFSDLKDAEATKAKLVSDGYNPILKR